MSSEPPHEPKPDSDETFLHRVRQALESTPAGGSDAPTTTRHTDETVTQARTPARAPLPHQIGRYRIKRRIASGGMGTVYEAMQDSPRRAVAVKVMKHGIASKSALRRFEYESQLLARLRHPGVAQVYEAGTHDDGDGPVPYFAMEYVPNARTLTQYAKEHKLSTRERLELFVKVCDAVHHGHQKGIIHRDLKPSNVLVDSSGQIKIIDFGVARSTDSDLAVTTLQTSVGQLVGTLQYMSPEQCEADPHDIDIRSDVYSLGVVLYELLTDKVPYDVTSVTMFEATRVIRERQPPRLSTVNRNLRGDVETIVLKALEKERDRRYQSAADLGQDVLRFLKSQPIIARPPSMIYHLRVFVRRNRVLVGAVAAVFAALVAGTITSTVLYLRAELARVEAEQRRLETEEIARFLNQTFLSVDPEVASGRDVTVKEILDDAAARIGTAFRALPRAEARLRLTIGESYRVLGKLSDAEEHLRAAVRVRKQLLGSRSLETAEALHALGALFEQRGEYEQAAANFLEALDIRRDLLERDDPQVIENLDVLAVVHWRQGNYDEAETLWREVLEAYQSAASPEQRRIADLLDRLGVLRKTRGDLAGAEQLQRDALSIRRRTLPANHPWLAESLNNLAATLVDAGRPREAEPLHRESLSIRRRAYGERHPYVAQSLANLAEVLRLENRLDEAEVLVLEALDMQRELVGERQPDLGLMYVRLGRIRYAKGRVDEAVSAFEDALAVFTGTLPATHWLIPFTRSLLGECLTTAGRFAEAETMLQEACEALEQMRGDRDAKTVDACHRLIDHYQTRGMHEAAKEYRDRYLPDDSVTREGN